MDILGWITVALGIIGAYLNVKKKISGFVFWIIANTIQIVIAFCTGTYFNMLLFGVYTFLSIYGIITWAKPPSKK